MTDFNAIKAMLSEGSPAAARLLTQPIPGTFDGLPPAAHGVLDEVIDPDVFSDDGAPLHSNVCRRRRVHKPTESNGAGQSLPGTARNKDTGARSFSR
jgi:hypothetical protein